MPPQKPYFGGRVECDANGGQEDLGGGVAGAAAAAAAAAAGGCDCGSGSVAAS